MTAPEETEDPVEYEETEVDPGEDPTQDILEMLAKGHPWVFLTTHLTGDDGFGVKMSVGGGIRDTETIRSLLQKTLNAIP